MSLSDEVGTGVQWGVLLALLVTSIGKGKRDVKETKGKSWGSYRDRRKVQNV
jgi:hypothetical protein